MCSHVALTRKDGRAVARELDAEVPEDFDEKYKPRDKIGPQSAHWMLRAAPSPSPSPSPELSPEPSGDTSEAVRRILVAAKLGLPNRARQGLLINARAETVHRIPTMKDAFVRRRCLIPADAFYEWSGEKAERRAHLFKRRDGGLILIGALYEEDTDPKTGLPRTQYVILTTRPNQVVSKVKERMPVIVPPESWDEWLRARAGEMDIKKLVALMGPAPEELLVMEDVPAKSS